MILLHLAPGAEEDKKHNDGTSSYHCFSKRKTQYTIWGHRTEVYQYRWPPQCLHNTTTAIWSMVIEKEIIIYGENEQK